MQTQQFEKEMRGKFDTEEAKLRETGGIESAERARREWLITLSKDGGLLGIPGGGAVPSPPDMSDCIISDVFVPYLAAYVSWERSKMEEKFRDVVGDTSGPLDAFASAAQLLHQVRARVVRVCVRVCVRACVCVLMVTA
jgi:hypothetical protein